jgi:hypothetical protein
MFVNRNYVYWAKVTQQLTLSRWYYRLVANRCCWLVCSLLETPFVTWDFFFREICSWWTAFVNWGFTASFIVFLCTAPIMNSAWESCICQELVFFPPCNSTNHILSIFDVPICYKTLLKVFSNGIGSHLDMLAVFLLIFYFCSYMTVNCSSHIHSHTLNLFHQAPLKRHSLRNLVCLLWYCLAWNNITFYLVLTVCRMMSFNQV